jgi:SAM-dependent MidA family methyltransferase
LNENVEKIAEEIDRRGPIAFARFMELALYCPDCGYYEKEKDNVGRDGDFFTSVSTGSLFGELLALQFATWAEEGRRKTEGGGQRTELNIVEAGAHDGRLAGDILRGLHEQKSVAFERLKYWIVEPSEKRRGWQRERLKEFGDAVQWVSKLTELETELRPFFSIVFSNELLDAMPVRRIGWDAKEKTWFEWGVAREGGKFVWTRMQNLEAGALRFPFDDREFARLADVLPDGFTTELCPAAEVWWREAASVLKRGKLLAIDYGLSAEEFFAPERASGTLRAYYRHHVSREILANPGKQDITASVNFTAIQRAGEAAGLKTEAFVTQAGFLMPIAEQVLNRPDVFGAWTPARTRQLQTLTHPEHLGRSFRVLVQSRQAGDCIS